MKRHDPVAKGLADAAAREAAGDLPGAEKCYKKVLQKAPNHPETLWRLGDVRVRMGRPRDGLPPFEKLVRIAPRLPNAHAGLGNALIACGEHARAAAAFEQAVALDPNHHPARQGLALSLSEIGDRDNALRHMRIVAEHCPADPGVAANLAFLLERAGRRTEGIDAMHRAADLAPRNPEMLCGAAEFMFRQGALAEGLALFHTWQKLTLPADACVQMGNVLGEAGLFEEALTAFRLAPRESPEVAIGEGRVLHRLGRHGEAHEKLKPVLEAGTGGDKALVLFGEIAHRVGRTKEAIRAIETRLRDKNVSPRLRAALCWNVAQLYDRQGEYDQAFPRFAEFNRLYGGHYDPDGHARWGDRVIAVFSPERIRDMPRSGNTSRLPVFIVGMPRSGTSLVEEIIASHPLAAGAGELTDIQRLSERLPGAREPYPEGITTATPELLDELAESYLQRLQGEFPDARRITDKMPGNFRFLGLIDRLFPEARVIHCIRDPRDTCLSCYFQAFVGGQGYAQDLGHLGHYYREYQRLMAHWRQTLSIPMLDVVYEDVVADQEGKSREIIDFLGLGWDDACLKFYESKRVVRTSSYDQVKQPVYTRSVARWQRYEKHLGPLLDTLGDAVDDAAR